jgi:hypothetical protein
MISEKEIFERLMKGENLDDIMNEITASVNGALEAKKKADAEEAKRKAEAEAKAKEEAEAKARKDAAMFNLDAIINGLCGLLVVYGYTDEAAELAKMDETDKEDLLASMDSMMEFGKAMMMLNGTTFPLGGTKPKVEKKVEATTEKPVAKKKKVVVVDPFEEFFKKMGI